MRMERMISLVGAMLLLSAAHVSAARTAPANTEDQLADPMFRERGVPVQESALMLVQAGDDAEVYDEDAGDAGYGGDEDYDEEGYGAEDSLEVYGGDDGYGYGGEAGPSDARKATNAVSDAARAAGDLIDAGERFFNIF